MTKICNVKPIYNIRSSAVYGIARNVSVVRFSACTTRGQRMILSGGRRSEGGKTSGGLILARMQCGEVLRGTRRRSLAESGLTIYLQPWNGLI